MDIRELLRELCLTPGVGGQTAITHKAKTLLSAYTGDITVSPLGNVVGMIRSGKDHAPLIMLEAHMDQIGLVVTGVEEGFLRVAPCGGVDNRTLTAADVVVYGEKPYAGVFAGKPPHLSGGEKDLPPLDERMIDVGMDQATAEKVIPVGSRVGFRPRFETVGKNGVAGTSLDDRCGMAAVLLAVDACVKEGLNADVAVCFTVQEELGTRGAGSSAFEVIPDASLSVDVSFARTPDANPRECGEWGKGPMIGISPSLDEVYSRRLIALAEEENIPYQREVMGDHTGTNADVIGVAGSGVRTALVSIPQRYMHTPSELVNVADVENTARLMVAFVQKGGVCR